MVEKANLDLVKGLVDKYQIPLLAKSEVNIKSQLGNGGEAIVYLGMYKYHQVAVKVITSFDQKCFEQEIAILSKLEHKNIPKFYGLIIEDSIAIVMQYIKGGTMAQIELSELRTKFKLVILKQLAEVLEYMHSNGYVHRDLKPDNILLTEKAELYLIDFGISKEICEEEIGKVTRAKGTLLYLAPETLDIVELTNQEDIICLVTSKVDVWAFGCIVVFLFTGKDPWLNEYSEEIVQINLTAKLPFPIPKSLDKSVHQIVEMCTVINPEERANMTEVKKLLESLL
jgi:serine/threonine protein kinase